MENKKKILNFIYKINNNSEKKDEKLAKLIRKLIREIEKNLNNIEQKSNKELKILLLEIDNLKGMISHYQIKREINRSILFRILEEIFYREQRCQQKNISRTEFKKFWKELTGPSNCDGCDFTPEFLSLYEKIFEREFLF
jgi:hypothetical protein